MPWHRGQGYYNANVHERPLTREQFDAQLPANLPEPVRTTRYNYYLIAWEKKHDAPWNDLL